ncbi:MAG: flavin reductase [Parvibaculales bacterium]
MSSEQIELRNALGQFATGVTVVTTFDEEQKPVGVTASSFNSVSLDPPLILWSLSKNALSMPAFKTSGGFNVHVLAAHQQDMSNNFARSQGDKFESVAFATCEQGFPVLPEYAALFRCRTYFEYEGGDHIIFVGEVLEHKTNDLPVLIFHGGKYAEAQAKPTELPDAGIDLESGQFSENFLLYLISRAHFQTSQPIRASWSDKGLSDEEYFCISLLSMNGDLSKDAIGERLRHTGHAPDNEIFSRLERKGLVSFTGSGECHLEEAGRDVFIELLAQSKSLEEELAKHFTQGELQTAINVMKKIIAITGKDIPDLW